MPRSNSKHRIKRPLEEIGLIALMFLLICAGLSFIGIVVVAETSKPPELVADSPLDIPTVDIPTAGPTETPLPTATPLATLALLPEPTETPTPIPTPVKWVGTYKVQNGDTLLGIALRAGVTLDAILLANLDILDPNKLSIDQAIKIPEGGKIPPGPPPASNNPPLVRTSSNINYPSTGRLGSYVPLGAMSVSAEHIVKGKRYPAGTFEYLHGQLKIPFPLPYISKSTITLPPPMPPNQCPLTGLPLTDPSILNRKPLNVRIDNASPARPQSGLSGADMVFETLAEGGITRFTAVFLCHPPSLDIGPIRSARLIDLQLAPMFKAILVHVGASALVTDLIWSSEIGEYDFDPVFRGTPGFGRIPQRPSPHNLYSSTGSLWSVAASRSTVGPVDLEGLSFSANAPAGGKAGTRAAVPYSGVSSVSYAYNAGIGLYTKFIGGALHVDADTGQALKFSNVIILFAKATYTDVIEDGIASRSLHFNVQGTGRAILLRDGQSFDVIWHHEGRNILFHYTDASGNHIPLKPGPTMVNIVPLELRVSVE